MWEIDDVRVKIWHLMTDRLVEKPLAGWGFRASRSMTGSIHNGHEVPVWHPHNVGLEIAMELGTVGLLLIAVFLWILERRIAALDDDGRVTATGLFVTTLIVCTSAYGIWQAHALLSMVFGFMAWKVAMLSRRSSGAPVLSAVRD